MSGGRGWRCSIRQIEIEVVEHARLPAEPGVFNDDIVVGSAGWTAGCDSCSVERARQRDLDRCGVRETAGAEARVAASLFSPNIVDFF
jgi:hypothetical protein